MNPEALSKQLATIKSRDEFRELFMVLHHWSKPQLFEALFPIASDYKTYPWSAYSVATDLLVALEPDCPFSCRETLERLGRGLKIEAGHAQIAPLIAIDPNRPEPLLAPDGHCRRRTAHHDHDVAILDRVDRRAAVAFDRAEQDEIGAGKAR